MKFGLAVFCGGCVDEMSKYIYGIVDQSAESAYGSIGINEGNVSVISIGPFGAVCSDVSDQRIRPERKNLAAHNAVIKRIIEDVTILPMSFGTIAESADEVKEILRKNRVQFAEQLKRLNGKVEMGLRISLIVPNIFEYMVNSEPELSDLRDRIYAGHRVPTHNDQIELGRTFDRLLGEMRETCLSSVMDVLSSLVVEFKSNPPRNESEVANLAALINRNQIQRFEDGIQEAALLFDNNFSFDYSGPWACYNFVDLVLTD